MGAPDTVPAVLPPYLREFTLWGCEGKSYKQHDLVPEVGMADTYAVLLESTENAAARFLTVQENRITNLMAHQPIDGRSVFDVRGRYLGRGGEELDVGEHVTFDRAISMVEMATRSGAPVLPKVPDTPPTVLKETAAHEEPQCHVHRFWLRENLEIKLELPLDLTDEEAQRIAVFVTTLPLAVRREG